MSDLDAFFDLVKEMAVFLFNGNGEHRPLFYLEAADSDGIGVLPADWRDVADKQGKFLMMRAALDLGAVTRCCLVHRNLVRRISKTSRRDQHQERHAAVATT